MRSLAWPLAAAALSLAVPAAADPLIGFTDNTFGTARSAFLSDLNANWAVGWTQTVATTDVTVRALLQSSQDGPANWWITTALGPTATLADVVASGVYTAASGGSVFNFNALPRTELASGLSFAAGSYFLVLDGQAGPFLNNGEWIGGDRPADTVQLASGFSLGSYYGAQSSFLGGPDNTPLAFGPASSFVALTDQTVLVFELDGQVAGVPEPAAWALMIGGFAFAGAMLRRRRLAVGVPPAAT